MSDFLCVRREALRLLLGSAGASVLPRAALAFDPTPDGFRDEVLAVGRQRFGGAMPPLTAGPGTTDLIWGDHHLYVDNLYAAVRTLPAALRPIAILDWLERFSPQAQAQMEAAKKATDDWSHAKALLRPKLQPQAVARTVIRLVRQPFSPGLVIAYAIDLGDKDLYVMTDKLAAWSVPVGEVNANAIANLEGMSAKIPLVPKRSNASTGSYLVIETGDGYDAARLLLPAFRARLLAAMGPSLRAGVPGRDALLVWSPDSAMREVLESNVRRQATEMPHPLSAEIFAFDASGLRLAADGRRVP